MQTHTLMGLPAELVLLIASRGGECRGRSLSAVGGIPGGRALEFFV